MKRRTTYYDILGLSQDATAEEIKSAFRKLAIKYHPDSADSNSASDSSFIVVHNAYTVLMDAGTKKKYDAYLDSKKRSGTRLDSGMNAHDYIVEEELREFNYLLWDIEDLVTRLSDTAVRYEDLYDFAILFFKYLEENVLHENYRFNSVSGKKSKLKIYLTTYFYLLRIEIQKHIERLTPDMIKSEETIDQLTEIKDRMQRFVAELRNKTAT